MATQEQKKLEAAFEKWAGKAKLKTSPNSHFEGEKYVMAKPFTVSLKWGDARLGNRIGIVLNLPEGCLTVLSGFLTPSKLLALMESGKEDFKTEIARYKKTYKD